MPDWGGRFASPIEHARALYMFSATDHSYRQSSSPIVFQETQTPGGNVRAFGIGTMALRDFAVMQDRLPEDHRLRGIQQIDAALAGSYGLMGIATETIEIPRASGEPIKFRGYSREMLLAAKLSWIVRNIRRETRLDARDVLAFSGEPKDFYDAHLLVTKRGIAFRGLSKCFPDCRHGRQAGDHNPDDRYFRILPARELLDRKRDSRQAPLWLRLF